MQEWDGFWGARGWAGSRELECTGFSLSWLPEQVGGYSDVMLKEKKDFACCHACRKEERNISGLARCAWEPTRSKRATWAWAMKKATNWALPIGLLLGACLLLGH